MGLAGVVLGAVLGVVALFVVAGSDDSPLGPGSIAARHGSIANPELAASVGDCLTGGPDEADVTTRDDVVVCENSHGSEVIGIVSMPDLAQPSRGDDLDFFADDACRLVFRDYVGASYDDTDLWFGAVPPSDTAWDQGERRLYCLLESHGYRDGRGSARDSAR